jgi:threonine dehydrogenase-like Zn-dependent dehydrogenase
VRAAVTRGSRQMAVVDVPEPSEPGPGEVLVRPEAVGLCGSDFHYYMGDIGGMDEAERFPRIQGHEVAATVEAVGDRTEGIEAGARVAIWPVNPCGNCYPCRIGRGNVCVDLRLIGIHFDGALQEQVVLPRTQVFPVGELPASTAALIEPVSIAVRSVARGRVAEGERVVVLGAGPIGQAVALAALDRGAKVLLVDRIASRLEHGTTLGADTLLATDDEDGFAKARDWAGGDGPEVVFEATGVPALVKGSLELVAQAGRVVVVGLSTDEAPIRVGALPFKEIDLLGVSCCAAEDFAGAVDLVQRRADAASTLVTHEFPLEQAPEAIDFAIGHPAEVMKAVVRVGAH